MIARTRTIIAAIALVAIGSLATWAYVIYAIRHSAFNSVVCRFVDIAKATTLMQKSVLRAAREEWLSQARVCSVGGFSIVVPATQTVGQTINVYKGRKPVLRRRPDYSLLYGPTVADDRFDQDLVNVWHPCEGDVRRLFYDTRSKESRVTVADLNFDGMPDTRSIWGGDKISQSYGMYQGAWHQFEKSKMLIDGQWQSMHFEDGEWRTSDSGHVPANAKSSDVLQCIRPQ